ncbi:glutaredoxin 2 [Bacterioplanoides sp.]|uniref:glutaredoxin 2 n=1 Tax=Bacterioplanoides sp. TaxID=2066072 RepID=UPI003AFF8C17
MKLFVFDHCPFCIKATMLVGLKKMPVTLETIQNHDVQARIAKVGSNSVPILQKDDGSHMAESLDIVRYLDQYDGQPVLAAATQSDAILAWEQQAYPAILPLLFPRTIMVDFPEFASDEAKQWFRQNKTAMLGMSFEAAFDNSAVYLQHLNNQLVQLTWLSLPSQRNQQLSYDDINLYPTLRNLTLIKGVQFPPLVRQYIEEVTALTGVRLLDDVAV